MRATNVSGLRLIQLYFLLASSTRSYSLHRLSEIFHCSRQSILRSFEQLELVEGIEVESWREGREKVYRGRPREKHEAMHLNLEGLRHLQLCRDLVRHLLPKPLQDEINSAIGAASSLFGDADADRASAALGDSFGKGIIDYGPFQDRFDAIQKAVDDGALCKVQYAARHHDAPKTYTVAPVSLLRYREALYFRCLVCNAQGKPIEDAPRTLAIQRIRHIENLDHPAPTLPAFPELENFGFPVHAPIKVRVAFTENAADYIRERQWSPDQRIRNRKTGGILLTFTATNQKEVLSWVLSFGPDAELLEPKALRVEMRTRCKQLYELYENNRK